MSKHTPEYYNYEFNGVKVDVYRILRIFNITQPAQQHAIKKLLRAGRSNKSTRQDVIEVIGALNRWLEMMDEELEQSKSEITENEITINANQPEIYYGNE